MTKSTSVLCSLILLLTGCATTQQDADAPASHEVADGFYALPAAPERTVRTSIDDPDDPAGVTRMGGPDLAIWSDPAFKRHVAESYMAETDIEPRITADERKAMLEILDLIGAGEQDKAAAKLEGKRGPASSAVFDFALANIRLEQDRLGDAVISYQAAVDKFPKFRRAWRMLGELHTRQAEYEKAIPALTRTIELGGGDGFTYGLLGVAYSNVDNAVSAESSFRMANLLHPEMMAWRVNLAKTFFKQERYAEAIALFGNLIAEQPDRADLWLAQGEAYAMVNQPLKAAENFEMVDRLGGATAGSLNNLGDIYSNQGLFEPAVDAYLRAMKKNPEALPERPLRAAKYLARSGALAETKTLVDGIQSVHGSRLSVEDQKDLLKLRARIAVATGASEEEVRVLEEVVKLDPLDGEALIGLGQHSHRTGDAEKAIFYYERAASLETFEADAKLRHAEVLVKQGKYLEALPLLRSAQTLKPRDNVQNFLENVERAAQGR
jgi:tetratricopeptide (TPR) repeat protein